MTIKINQESQILVEQRREDEMLPNKKCHSKWQTYHLVLMCVFGIFMGSAPTAFLPCSTYQECLSNHTCNASLPSNLTSTTRLTTAKSFPTSTMKSKLYGNADCAIYDEIVHLAMLTNMSDVERIHPEGITVKRCGGFCVGRSGHSCQPSRSTEVTVKIRVKLLNGTEETRSLTIPVHKECSCECKIKAKDCHKDQHYDGDSCKCLCDENTMSDCFANDLKSWHESTCSCACKETDDCSTGTQFDQRECRCT